MGGTSPFPRTALASAVTARAFALAGRLLSAALASGSLPGLITLGPGFRPYLLILVGESQQAHAPYSKSRERVPEPAVTLLISYFFPEGVPVPDHTTPLLLRARREGAKKGRVGAHGQWSGHLSQNGVRMAMVSALDLCAPTWSVLLSTSSASLISAH